MDTDPNDKDATKQHLQCTCFCVSIPFYGQQAIDAGIGDKLFCGTRYITGYSDPQTGVTLDRVKKVAGVE